MLHCALWHQMAAGSVVKRFQRSRLPRGTVLLCVCVCVRCDMTTLGRVNIVQVTNVRHIESAGVTQLPNNPICQGSERALGVVVVLCH
jgi:hypothetical protein